MSARGAPVGYASVTSSRKQQNECVAHATFQLDILKDLVGGLDGPKD